MIYTYEANILGLLHAIIPQLDKASTYSEEESVFQLLEPTMKLPVFFYSRSSMDWEFNKQLVIRDGSERASFVPYMQTYTGRILIENQGQAIKMASAIRYGIGKHPYVTLDFPKKDEPLDVQIRLTSIGIGEERSQESDKGAIRYVELKWQSQLFMCDYNDSYFDGKLVEKINIWVNPQGLTEAQIYNEQGVFMSVPLPQINF